MSREYEFIKECGVFYVLTTNKDFPAGRPFGAIMEIEKDLYVATADMKAVYQQLKENPNVQLLALKSGTRDWLRVTGIAEECEDISVKEKMLLDCPVLKKHYASADTPYYKVFKISVLNSEFN